MKRIVVAIGFLVMAQVSFAADQATVTSYNRACVACHSSGVAGAPRTFNANDWSPRLAKGMSTLVQNTVNGINAMPAKGLCPTCSEEDFEALIQYMSTPK